MKQKYSPGRRLNKDNIGIVCPHCGVGKRSRVLETRMSEKDWVRRLRECKDCGKRYATKEMTEVFFEQYIRNIVEGRVRDIKESMEYISPEELDADYRANMDIENPKELGVSEDDR